ncbi:HEAT repeat domain-containing protein [Coleofasciculus sp. FACHB-501]|uniref:HEAT repeat domain-containing protein n=1 Tax=Cyanophyceae TaxID=3028117 RepID=UPI0032206ABA
MMLLSVLEQATVAAQQKNWSLLNQCLQQLPLNKAEGRQGESLTGEDSNSLYLEQLLNLALDVLDAGDFQERWEVAKVLPKLGEGAIAPLISILKDEDADLEERWFAGRILGEFDNPAVITALVELLRTSEDEELTVAAAAALAHIGSPAVEALTELLAESETRLLAVRSLAQIRRSETIAPLLNVVQDPQSAIRAAAIEALGSFHDSRIPPVLMDALQDPAAQVRKEAVIGLGMRSDLLEQLNLVTQLQPLLFDFNLEVCQHSAIALGRLGTDEAAAALFQVLASPNTPLSLQVDIVRSLPQTAAALEYLQQALSVESPVLWQEIVTVLGRVDSPKLVPTAAKILVTALESESSTAQDPKVKQAVAMAWGQLGDAIAINQLIELLADPDAGVKLHAIAALKKFPIAYQQLQQLATTENLTPELKQGIAIALKEWTVNS